MLKQLLSSVVFLTLALSLPASAQLDTYSVINPPQAASSNGAGTTTPARQAGTVTATPAPSPSQPPAVVTNGAVPDTRLQTPQFYDYSANASSDVFGANLFTGAFAKEGVTQFNPDYALTVGDRIQVRLWGAFDFEAPLTVDPKGNILLPHAGPVRVLGVRNADLQRVVDAAVRKVFRSNVFSYASLAAAQPVRVFVSGFVNRPGLYSGTSMDSLLHYLDQAGGIDPERGSFLKVEVKRGTLLRGVVNLYDFLLDGTMPVMQLADGDVILVTQRQNIVRVTGLAENAKRFEFSGTARTVADLIRLAKPRPGATHVRIARNTGPIKNVEYIVLADAAQVALRDGDELEFTSDKKIGTITVRVEGEHQGMQEYVLPYGVRMSDLLPRIQYSERSDRENLQLFRVSIKNRQKQMLQTSLQNLEAAALTARSGTSDEARLRKDEADLLLQWVDRAKKIESNGQVVIAGAAGRDNLLLENGDIIRVPTKDGLVLVNGEVLFPSAVVFDAKLDLEDYVRRAGGFTQNAEAARIVVAHRDGTFDENKPGSGVFGFGKQTVVVRPGDEILVLPKIDVKDRQIWKDLTQIIYQIAVSAKVVLGL